MSLQGSLSIERMCELRRVSRASFYRSFPEQHSVEEEMNVGFVSEFVDSFQPTTQPTRTSVLYDFGVVWQSPRSCKLL